MMRNTSMPVENLDGVPSYAITRKIRGEIHSMSGSGENINASVGAQDMIHVVVTDARIFY